MIYSAISVQENETIFLVYVKILMCMIQVVLRNQNKFSKTYFVLEIYIWSACITHKKNLLFLNIPN